MAEQLGFRLVDGGSIPTPSLQVRKISSADAKKIVLQYHYSQKMPCGKLICFGFFIGAALYAVAVYGAGVNRNSPKFLKRITSFEVTSTNFLELMRLARIEPKIDFAPLSTFLSKCHKILKSEGYKYILSYSDPEFNPSGGIYAASNFVLLGMSKSMPRTFTDASGRRKW